MKHYYVCLCGMRFVTLILLANKNGARFTDRRFKHAPAYICDRLRSFCMRFRSEYMFLFVVTEYVPRRFEFLDLGFFFFSKASG